MRRYDIDYLRLFGIFLLFPFHAARVFDPYEANYVHSAVSSRAGSYFMAVIWPWFMPLMFLVAGISTYCAFQKRTVRQFLNERFFRLLIPLILGIIIIVPIQGYMARLQQGTLGGGYFKYLFTQFFTDFSDISGYSGTFTPAHLWFIMFLIVYSVLFSGLFRRIRNRVAEGRGSKIAGLFRKKWFLPLLFIVLTVCEGLPDIGGKNPFFYALYYLIGFCIAAYGSWEAIGKIKWQTLAATLISLALYFFMLRVAAGKGDFEWQSILLALIRNFYGLCAIFAMIALAQKYLNRGGKALSYLNQAAFPVYILHQSVMMVIAYYVIAWRAGIGAQFAVITLASLAASFALFELCRCFGPTRFLLGIKKSGSAASVKSVHSEV